MKNELLETLDILKKFNKYLGSDVISKEEFAEKEDDINDFDRLRERLQKVLHELKENTDKDNEEVFAKLVSLSNKYSDFIWYFEQVQELVNKIIRNYPL